MRNLTLTDLQRVVALGGGHGLGRVMSSLSFLGSRLTGIVTTTDNGGSTGRIRRSEGGIAWGDTRNCLNQLITTPSAASAMFEYRFGGSGELAGHNLGNLMLKALDNLSVRPLEAINLIRNLLQIDAELIPMSEQSADLLATDAQGLPVYGEVAVDQLATLPQDLRLFPAVTATREALDAIANADLLLIGPGSFLTSLMPLLLLEDLTVALYHSRAPMVYIANLDQELSPAASQLTTSHQIEIIEAKVGRRIIDAVILGPQMNTDALSDRLLIQQPLAAADVPHHHDRQLLREAIAHTQEQLALNLPSSNRLTLFSEPIYPYADTFG